MIENGLVIAGQVVPGTDWIKRDMRYFFRAGDRGARERAAIVDSIGGHWTGGEAGTKDPDGPGPLTEYDDDGARVVTVMRSRMKDGRPLHVGIGLVVAACDPDDDEADVWQTADLGLDATVHVGKGWLNARSVGIEVVNAGLPGEGDVRNVRRRPVLEVSHLGRRRRRVLAYFDGQLAAYVRACNMLADLKGRAGISIPRRVPAGPDGRPLLSRRFTLRECERWKGAFEHFHVVGTTKLDAAGMLIGALAADGWELTTP